MPPKHDIFDCIRSFGVKVVILGSEGAMTLPDFGRSVNSISTNGINYAHNIISAPPPSNFRRPYGSDIISYPPMCRGQVDRRQPASWFNPVHPRLCHVI